MRDVCGWKLVDKKMKADLKLMLCLEETIDQLAKDNNIC